MDMISSLPAITATQSTVPHVSQDWPRSLQRRWNATPTAVLVVVVWPKEATRNLKFFRYVIPPPGWIYMIDEFLGAL